MAYDREQAAARAAQLDEDMRVFADAGFRADLAAWSDVVRTASAQFAAEAVLLAALAARVPRRSGDTHGATAWTSFLQEIAAARRLHVRTASSQVAEAQHLVAALPRTLSLLQQGRMQVTQARALVEVTRACSDEVALVVDAAVAERACLLPAWKVRAAADKVVLRLDADAAAARAAAAAAQREARLSPLRDEQAELALTGPALPLHQAMRALDADARALKAAGDDRGLGALRFDLAVHRLLGEHAPVVPGQVAPAAGSAVITTDPTAATAATAATAVGTAPASVGLAAAASATAVATPASAARADEVLADEVLADGGPPGLPAALPSDCPHGLPDTSAPSWWTDRRFSRPVRLDVAVPVTTALGLSQEPGWLDGYGWVSAPRCRSLQVAAELRQVCTAADGPSSGQVLQVEPVRRPELTPEAVSAALLDMATHDVALDVDAWMDQVQHDPSTALDDLCRNRDVFCDGPTQPRVPAARADLDHDIAHPDGPTAAWNLRARSRRVHVLKHQGWTPVRSATSTLWFSPAGQLVEVPHWSGPDLRLDPEAALPDPVLLAELDAELLRTPTADDLPPTWPEPAF